MLIYLAVAIVVAVLISIGHKLDKLIANSNDIVFSLDLIKSDLAGIGSEVLMASNDLSAIKSRVKMIEAVALGIDRAASGDIMDD